MKRYKNLFDIVDHVAGQLGRLRRHARLSHGACVDRKGPDFHMWTIWQAMKQRCSNTKRAQYRDYGGRGITVCERWLIFTNFLEDVGHRPFPGASLDRINNDLGYFPENVRWTTQAVQNRNRRKYSEWKRERPSAR